MPNNRHVYLINERTSNPRFNRQRGFTTPPVEETSEPKIIQEFQKERLRRANASFFTGRRQRNENRTIQFPAVIDLIRIYFYCVFNDDLRNKFFIRYGLSPVEYSHFNKAVMFEIIDNELFGNFSLHIREVINSTEGTSYENRPFSLISLIFQFEFITERSRLFTTADSGILFTLISSANPIYAVQKRMLFNFLEEQRIIFDYNAIMPDILNVNGLSPEHIRLIARNFDIVKAITSTRSLKVRPGEFGNVRRDFGFTVTVPENLTTVAIIDTGVSRIDPLQVLINGSFYDHSGNGAFWDEAGHGTMVAGLVVLGDDFHIAVRDNYVAKAKILVIKALHTIAGDINIPQLLSDIKDAKRRHGIRLFNMSLNIPFAKKYNDGYSQFAYELDKLAFEEDVLIFISVGNIDADYIEELTSIDFHPDHDYPTFFYKIDSTSPSHLCKNTNISEPSESLNNLSIGALAGNLEEGDNSDLTPGNLYPAYYSRKFHFDYTQAINTAPLRRNQRNKHLNKPDLVFEGGDLFRYESGMEVLRSPMAENEQFFGRACGTSLATPLVASYAAEVLNNYPELRTQTIKAMLINTASFEKRSNLPHFSSHTDALLKSMVGFGKPQKSKLLVTDDNSITFVIEDTISVNEIIAIPINLPGYLLESGNKLKFDISLCYSFLPVKNNHLNYLPLHISFNLLKNVDIETIADAEQEDYGIKNSFSWSEDHFGIENRLFSNAQFKSYRLQPADFQRVGDAVALGVRCLSKNEIPGNHLNTITNNEHHFSIIVTVSELSANNATSRLYSEMLMCNQIENIADAAGIADLEADA